MKKILIVEDDQFTRTIFETTFSQEYELMNLMEGETALEKATSFQPDLILLDLVLPGKKDGFEILKELKEHPSTMQIPVIIVSNLGQDEEIARAKDMGAIEYFIKSNTDIHHLAEVVRTYLAN